MAKARGNILTPAQIDEIVAVLKEGISSERKLGDRSAATQLQWAMKRLQGVRGAAESVQNYREVMTSLEKSNPGVAGQVREILTENQEVLPKGPPASEVVTPRMRKWYDARVKGTVNPEARPPSDAEILKEFKSAQERERRIRGPIGVDRQEKRLKRGVQSALRAEPQTGPRSLRPSPTAFEKIRDAAGQRASQAADWAAKKIDERDLGGLAKRTGPPEPRGRIKGAKSAYQKKLRLEGIAAARSKRLEAEAPWLVKQLKKRPGATALGAGNLALMFGPQLVKSLRDELNIGGYMDEQTDRLIGAQAELNSYARMQRRREEELNRLMQVNTAMLAQRSPELYNQIMAGRRLPQQATVIGGQPREDLLREVARGMSEGRYGTPEEMMGG